MKESDGIENGVKWEIGVVVVRFRPFSITMTQKYEKNVIHRIWLKSVKQIPRYGFSPKSKRCHAHCLILNAVPIKSYHTIPELKFNASGVFSA